MFSTFFRQNEAEQQNYHKHVLKLGQRRRHPQPRSLWRYTTSTQMQFILWQLMFK